MFFYSSGESLPQSVSISRRLRKILTEMGSVSTRAREAHILNITIIQATDFLVLHYLFI